MTTKANAGKQGVQKLNHIQKQGPNWVLIAGGALLSTLTIKLGCKLKQAFEMRRNDNARQANRRSTSKNNTGSSKSHSGLYLFNQDEEACNHCLPVPVPWFQTNNSGGRLDVAKQLNSISANDSDIFLPLVEIPTVQPNKDSGVMWISSPDRLEMPRKPLHHSNSSGSPCASESGSDVYCKREVIQKLRQQLKRRDEMIMEMQAPIADLQNSLNIQFSQSEHLQAQLDCASRDLYSSEREIQKLRMVIADHCSSVVVVSSEKLEARRYHPQVTNGFTSGYPDSINDVEVSCVAVEKVKLEKERIEMLKSEVKELKELIEAKDFLLQSYKEQKIELCSNVKELQLKLASQVPNIL